MHEFEEKYCTQSYHTFMYNELNYENVTQKIPKDLIQTKKNKNDHTTS